MLLLSSVDHVLILVAGGLTLALVERRFPTLGDSLRPLATGWRAPAVVGCLAAIAVLWVWWPSRSVAVVHDEASYLLQAELLARGRFTAPAPLVPELSEQAAVLVVPVLAPKPMPGQALALVPGVAIGLPWAGPVLLSGLTAAAIFLLVRLVAGAGSGVLAVVLWISAPGVLRWQPSYFSEVTSTALVLLGWLAAYRWWRSQRAPWLFACALAFALLGITRPLTAMAQALPVAGLLLSRVAATRRWRDLAYALCIGGVPLLLVPAQSRAVTGAWNRTPWSLYAEQYIPWDHPGFGLDDRQPTRALPPDLESAMEEFKELHREHTLAALPAILTERVRSVGRQQTIGWRQYLLPILVVVGTVTYWRIGLLMGLAAVLQFGLYLTYAHQAHWTLYYAELIPMAMILGALGMARVERSGSGRRGSQSVVSFGLALILVILTLPTLGRQRRQHLALARPWLALDSALATTGTSPRFVLVRYGPSHDPHQSLVRNSTDGGDGQLQLLYEPPASRDSTLRLQFPRRQAWRYDAITESIMRLW
ncbi:MAG: hypothetical protein ABI542_07125 [Gemmatimonadota bacterium]